MPKRQQRHTIIGTSPEVPGLGTVKGIPACKFAYLLSRNTLAQDTTLFNRYLCLFED